MNDDHLHQVGQQRDEADADADADQGDQDRQAHGEHRPEGDEQDDDGGEQADRLGAARRGLRVHEDVAAKSTRSPGPGWAAWVDGVLDGASPAPLGRSLDRHVELDLGEGDLSVGRDLRAPCGAVGAGHTGHVGVGRRAAANAAVHPLLDLRRPHARGPGGREHDVAGVTRPGRETCFRRSKARCDSVPGSEKLVASLPPAVWATTLTRTTVINQAARTARRWW